MKTNFFYNISLADLHIDLQELYLLMGYGDHTPDSTIVTMAEEMLKELASLCEPRCGYILVSGESVDKQNVNLEGVNLKTGAIITSALRKAESYAIFTATLGDKFDQWLAECQKRDIVEEFVANTLGSILVEAVVSWLMEQIRLKADAEGLSITNNYSPGYCDWALDEQRKIFFFFAEDITGIRLTDSCLMLPIKSVSGIVGIGKQVKKQSYGCNICKMTNCVRNQKRMA